MTATASATRPAALPLGALLVRHALGLAPEVLTPARLEKTKLCLLDLLSCIFGAQPMPWNRAILAYAERGCGHGGSAVPGVGEGCPPVEAAFINSVLAAGASRSDIHPPSISHPGLVIVPTLLALLGERPVSGRDFLLAVLAGYEAMGRAGRALVTAENSRRFRPSGLCGPIGAALAAARLLALDEKAALSALGIAGNAAGGPMEWAFSGAPDLRYQPAQAARAGTAAALMAREGVEGSHSILEGPGGLLATFGAAPGAEALLSGAWGASFEIDTVEFKAVPVCVHAQAAAFAAQRLVEQAEFAADEIEDLAIATYGKAVDYPGCAATGPIANAQEARMSIPFAVASVLVLQTLGDANFVAVDDPRIASLASRARLRCDDDLDAAFPVRQQARIELTLAEGCRLGIYLEDLPPFGPDEVRARFRACADAALGARRAAELAQAIEVLEDLPDAAVLGDLLRPE